ncbi:unnamed protein product [Closterium sp. Yama58-4]|nr:unnamed protein product [Closterium sp. Yama58-4]
MHPMPEKSPSCDFGSESCRVGSACDSPGRELMSLGSDDRRCDAPPSATCEEPIRATARVVTYRRFRRVMADGGRRTATITDFKIVSAPAPSTSGERPRGTSTLASWLRQGNGSGKERLGGASCPSDVPRVGDDYEIQRLRKSKLKRKAEASIGEGEQRSTEERQGREQARQQGLEQEREQAGQQGLEQGREQAGQQEQKLEVRAGNERQGLVHEGQEQADLLRSQEEQPRAQSEAQKQMEKQQQEEQQQQQQQQRGRQQQRRQVQACLDFGQKDLLHCTCRVCGFMFAKGLKADEMAHEAHHRLFCGTVTIQADEAAHDAHHRLFCGTVTVQVRGEEGGTFSGKEHFHAIQKRYLLHCTCRVCGLVFAKGLKADEAAHEAHHRLFCGTVTIQVTGGVL